ncbi:2OG-Fe(II) oxygenase [Cytobacillus dafuensis]|uniref:2-oxoglutarate-dependent dioxygenase n=1 Tax=Cytobacillus dafuensis TaxID=1742359 RepID=A0A5B8Z3X6_CYTDA|nr:2OG-Fe(II) oxygenase [Cytobacillus dafuensis]QED47812.1 2-oxoglutarate-dependent dioxygenase [Cytobacillus dafuensis]
MQKISSISNELKDWILNTLKSGVNPESIVQGMIKKGFDQAFAYSTIIRILNNQAVNTVDREHATYLYETLEIANKGNIISTSEREIKVLLKIDKPYILYLDNVLSHDECNQLIELSKNRLEPSQIIDTYSGERKLAAGRTSKGAYYKLNENNFISKIENRIAEITNHPIVNGEGLQVLNYELGEEYKAHFDYFPSGQIQLENGGQRIATFLMYLNDVEEGGETIFPKIGLSIVPKKGTALYFHYGNSKGQVDRLSLHSSVPVTKGEKWVSTKWIREGMILQ